MTAFSHQDTIAFMAEKDLLTITLEAGKLLDYYGCLLNEKQNRALTLYYNEDLSLSEIAEIMNISRQAVHEQIKNGIKSLLAFEDRLALVNKSEEILALLDKLDLALNNQDKNSKKLILKIKELI